VNQQVRLADQVAMVSRGMWPTPTATDYKGAQTRSPGKERPVCDDDLPTRVVRMWQTPVADDAVDREKGKVNSRGEPKLSAQVKQSPGQSTGSLNPQWVEWLMNWPLNWTRRNGGAKSPKASRASRKASLIALPD
jgi:hypothetical protein